MPDVGDGEVACPQILDRDLAHNPGADREDLRASREAGRDRVDVPRRAVDQSRVRGQRDAARLACREGRVGEYVTIRVRRRGLTRGGVVVREENLSGIVELRDIQRGGVCSGRAHIASIREHSGDRNGVSHLRYRTDNGDRVGRELIQRNTICRQPVVFSDVTSRISVVKGYRHSWLFPIMRYHLI